MRKQKEGIMGRGKWVYQKIWQLVCSSFTSVHGYSFGVSFELWGYFKNNLAIIRMGE